MVSDAWDFLGEKTVNVGYLELAQISEALGYLLSHSVRQEVIGIWEESEFVSLACVVLAYVVRMCSCGEARSYVF